MVKMLLLAPRSVCAVRAVRVQHILQLHTPNCMCVWPRALDEFPALQVRSAEGTRRIRVESGIRLMTYKSRGRRFARPFSLDEAGASVGEKRLRGSREQAPVNVQCEPKDKDEVAHQQLPSNFAISFEARMA